jgi:hypothetical protein
MDEIMLLKMLDEINSMSAKEYWDFFEESQKLSDFLPCREPNWETLPVMGIAANVVMFSGISFSTEYKKPFEIYNDSYYSESEDTIWFQVA